MTLKSMKDPILEELKEDLREAKAQYALGTGVVFTINCAQLNINKYKKMKRKLHGLSREHRINKANIRWKKKKLKYNKQ